MLDARLAWMAEGNCFCLHSFSAVCLQFFLSCSSYSLYNGKKNVNAKRTKIFGMYTFLGLNSQCGQLHIFLSLRFYVKSGLRQCYQLTVQIMEISKNAIFAFLEDMNFRFGSIQP